MNKIIESAWIELLTKATKKQGAVSDSGRNSIIDLVVPQSRLLALAESNRTVPRLIYLSAQESAKKNAYLIVRKLGMPSDYFWKFEFWPAERAYTTLSKIVHRIFSTIMNEAGEGKLTVREVKLDPLRVHIDFEGCVECAGIDGMHRGICYYHAGTFAGIIEALLNLDDLDCYETVCQASGHDCCSFVLGQKDDKEFVRQFDEFVSPPDIRVDLMKRLTTSLKKDTVRSLGNMVDVNYLRLVTANILLDNPRLFTTMNAEVGNGFGRNIAGIVSKFYEADTYQAVTNYYRDICHLDIDITEQGEEIRITVSDMTPTVYNTDEMISFLVGEFTGLLSGLTGRNLQVSESSFAGENLIIRLVP